MGSGFFSQDNPPPAEQSPAGPGPGNVVVQEPTGVDGATASFYGRGAAPALQAFEEDAKAAAGEAAASAAAAAASAVASAASAGEALNVATGINASVNQAEAAKNAAQASATNSANSATAAAGSASAANTSATQASTSATNAGNSATAAATSATNSATSAASAVSSASQAASSANSVNAAATTATAKAAEATASATNAANSATSASTSASTATTKATEAATSASAAAGSATTAGASATAAGTSATNAANSASAAGTSATNAAASAATATTKASESSTSATNAASSATSAAGSATTATTKASEASTSATNAAASATTATTKASEASTSATNAANSASAAATSATNAANSASAAGTSATNAANSATAAAGSATAAAGSATAAAGSAANASSAQSAAESARDATLAAFDSFDDRYLGTKTSNPTVDNDGNALVAGALYFNSTAGEMRVWTGSVWTAAYVSGAGVLLQANNLSDLANASTARTNIGLGNVENKSSATIRGEITSSNVTTALGFTPYNATNPSSYITTAGARSAVSATGSLSYNSTTGVMSFTDAVTSVAGKTGAVTLTNTDVGLGNVENKSSATIRSEITGSNVTTALGYTPIQQGGGAGQSTNKLYVGWTGSALNLQVDATNFAATWPISVTGNAATVSSITSGQVTTALGYTPYNATNPAGYITSSALSAYLPLTGGSLNVGGVSSTHSFLYNESGGEIQLVDSTGAGPILLDNSGGLARFLKVGSGSMALGTTSTGTLRFQTADAERMRIDSDGDVGIGTTAPTTIFHVQQNTTANIGMRMRQLSTTQFAGAGLLCNGPVSSGVQGGTAFYHYNRNTGGTNGALAMAQFDENGSFQRSLAEYYYNEQAWLFYTNGSERLRITSAGNVGIGTSSPGAKLDVVTASGANIVVSRSSAAGYAAFQRIAPSGQQAYDFYTINGVEAGRITVDGSNFMAFATGSAAAERMRIDASGNVGIGTTNPAGYRLRVVGSSGSAQFRAGTDTNGYLEVNAFDSAPVYCVVAGANATAGVFGTQANIPTILFTNNTERMRITSAGNVGIGETSPGARLHVSGPVVGTTAGNLVNVTIDQGGAGSNAVGVRTNLVRVSNGTDWTTTAMRLQGRVDATNFGYIDFVSGGAQGLAFGSDASERMRIDSAGSVGLGTSSPQCRFNVKGGTTWIQNFNGANASPTEQVDWPVPALNVTSFGDFTFQTMMTFTLPNDGNYFAGDTVWNFRLEQTASSTTSSSSTGLRLFGPGYLAFGSGQQERLRFATDGTATFTGLVAGRATVGSNVNTNNDTGSFSVRSDGSNAASMSFHRTGAYAINMGLGTDNVFRIGGWSASSNCFQMDGSGNLTMLGNVTAYSDARMKKDVETIDSALDLVSKMRGVRYTRIDNDKRGVGVIAQEMLKVLPEVVQQGVGDDDTLSVAYGNLVGVLIEAIKELKVEVETLKGKNP